MAKNLIEYARQEVLYNYNGSSPPSENLSMTLIHRTLIFIQLLEMVCFVMLFKFIVDHDGEMFRRCVISDDVYKRRRQDNAFTGFKEFIMFTFKMVYLLFFFFIKICGERYFGKSFTATLSEFVPYARVFEFAINSTIQLLSIRELRNRILTFLSAARVILLWL